LAAPDPRTLTITLDQPAGDFLRILTQSFFAPVPEEHADDYEVGKNYDGQVVGSGPYKLTIYVPGETVVLDRNPNWDPATDPLRRARVDRIQVKFGFAVPTIQRAIDRGQADLSLITHLNATQVATFQSDPERTKRLSVEPSGCQLFLILGTNPRAGAIANVRVRQAVNYAIDKVAYRDAMAKRYAPTGELASTLLAPGTLGYQRYDRYPTPGGRGDPARAKALLAEAGYPNGLTLSYATTSTGTFAASTKTIKDSLARAGIRLNVNTYKGGALWEESLQLPAKRLEHQLGHSIWCQDYPGDNARQWIVNQYDGRLPLDISGNFSEYNNRHVNRLIDLALAEPDPTRRAALWAQTDRQIMDDAPTVPLIWENRAYLWAPRVHGWVYDPWTAMPDLTAPWLDPPTL
jgi:peptide/nickel transport system substrate-binding protein